MNDNTKKAIRNQIICDVFWILIFCLLIYYFYPTIKALLPDSYNISETVKQMCSFWEACIAIYIGVISIFATARTSVADKLSKENKHYNFIVSTSSGFTSTVITLILSYIFYDIHYIAKIFTVAMIIISFFKIIVFFSIVLIIFSLNVSSSCNEAASEEGKHNEIINALNRIQNILSDIIRKNNK